MCKNQCFIILLIAGFFMNCSHKTDKDKIIVVKNTLNIDRFFETVEITLKSLSINSQDTLEHFAIRDMETNELVITQLIDNNGDDIYDLILFQPQIPKLSERKFEIVRNESILKKGSKIRCYSRFVPERMDDFAWENNKVAFRTFGPAAQKMIEEDISGGTLSSGIDAWLKKVEYPIINKWYKKTITGTGSYHKDTGEGLDNFHVGVSRGVGGTAVKIDSIYYFSKNFISWKIISNGPIRTSFVLEYHNWSADGVIIKEIKNVSLDFGSNLSRYEVLIDGVNQISTGLTLHENDGIVTVNEASCWFSYWQPHGASELGTAIVVPKEFYYGYEKYETLESDLSNLYVHLKVKDNKAVYYAGFGWKENRKFKTAKAWESYLQEFVKKMNNPLNIEVK